MARTDTNRSGEMDVFVRVVDLGGFTAAANSLRQTPSGVSKLVSRLETRLGTRLVNRTTRKLQLTEEGQAFYQRAQRILADIDEAEREAASCVPRDHLTVNSNIPFGMLHVMPLLPRFMREHPDITLDVVLTDTLVDLMQARADVAIRAGPLGASRLIARKLGTSRMAVVAAPSYLARRGQPRHIRDLADHDCLVFTPMGSVWTFDGKSGLTTVAVRPRLLTNNNGLLVEALSAGGGIAVVSREVVAAGLRSGALIEVLPEALLPDLWVKALVPTARANLARVQTLLSEIRDAFRRVGEGQPAHV